MAKTISDAKFKLAAKVIDTAVQPALKKIVDRANEDLAKHGIRIALDASWIFDEVETKKESSDED